MNQRRPDNTTASLRRGAPQPVRQDSWRRWRRYARRLLRVAVVLLLLAILAGWWVVLRIEEDPSWPPPASAVTADEAQSATAAFLQRDHPSVKDLAVPLAPSTATTVDFFSGGEEFFPPIRDDLSAAESSIHMLMFSITPGEVAEGVVDILIERAEAGIEVRLVVDGFGAKTTGRSAELFDQLQAAGVEVVLNNIFPLDRDGLRGDGSIDWRHDELGNADHRKMIVIDGNVGWIGGAGFEDHFLDGRYHDAYTRLTGDVSRQMQLVFLTSFHVLGGPIPEDTSLGAYFPESDVPGTIPATLLHNVPGGHLPGTQAIRQVIEGAESQVEILNPYLTDPGMVDRVVDTSERGVDVTVVTPGESNVPQAQAALHHNYPRLWEAGVDGYEYETIIHAKVIIADDTVIIGTINLDAWALYRNHEIAVIIEDPAVADDARTTLVDDVLSRSAPVEVPGGIWNDTKNWFWDKLVYFL